MNSFDLAQIELARTELARMKRRGKLLGRFMLVGNIICGAALLLTGTFAPHLIPLARLVFDLSGIGCLTIAWALR
jgi:hypothetical protein